MDALALRAVVLTAVLVSLGAGYRTPNFVVEASSEGLAQRVGLAAEKYRRELALSWLGKEMPDWAEPCPITVQVAPHLGAGGETSFVFDRGEVFGWKMRVQGSEERVLDSVLPHEVTHTILATHCRRPLPRWADEGSCTTVEHQSERNKQQNMLITFLRTNKGIAFSQMFAMKEYPPDILPLYAQGYSLARYLIEQGGRRKFLAYVAEGLKSEQWSTATKTYYGYNGLGRLQDSWLEWVKQGSPAVDKSLGNQGELIALADNRQTGAKTKTDAVPIAQARFQNDERSGRAQPEAGRDRSTPASTFESTGTWNARGESRTASVPLAQAVNSGRASRTIRSNKQSVYDRGVEASGNAQQYPFKASTSRSSTPSASAEQEGKSRAGNGSANDRTAKAAAYRAPSPNPEQRRIILEWSREGNPKQPTNEPLVDASW